MRTKKQPKLSPAQVKREQEIRREVWTLAYNQGYKDGEEQLCDRFRQLLGLEKEGAAENSWERRYNP